MCLCTKIELLWIVCHWNRMLSLQFAHISTLTYTHTHTISKMWKLLEKGTHFALISYGIWQTCATNTRHVRWSMNEIVYFREKCASFDAHASVKKIPHQNHTFLKQTHWKMCVCVLVHVKIFIHIHKREPYPGASYITFTNTIKNLILPV